MKSLDPARGPLFLQIAHEIQRWIAKGDLRPGDRLPSVRVLAETFRVNPNTVAHALEELSRAGVTQVRRGLGTYVREDLDQEELRRSLLRRAAADFLTEVRELGGDAEEAVHVLEEVAHAGATSRGD